MPALSEPLRGPLTRRFQQTIGGVSTRAAVTVQAAWDELDGYDDDNVDTLTAAATPTTSRLKAATFIAAVGYYTVLAGRPRPRMAVDDVPATPEFRDPFIATWRALKQGRPYTEAVAAGRSRVEAVVFNFANTTARQTGDLFVNRSGLTVHGWERIPNAGACDWCQLVAGQTYGTADSADFGHDRCGCSAAPRF